ncbi:MAG: hypothetical protein JRL30_21685 [Deltaproteobacteria bacterium]|nr:hypothetical protein [Deltaproteobacteria bacterium]
MKSRGKCIDLFVVLPLVAMVAFGCGDIGGTNPSNVSARVNVLFAANGSLVPVAQSAAEGAVSATDQGAEYTLTLDNLSEEVVWYTDRPERESGTETVQVFMGLWPQMYGEVSPNAFITTYIPSLDMAENYGVTIKTIEYDAGQNRLTMGLKILQAVPESLSAGSSLMREGLSGLEVEDIMVTILNNASGVSSFFQSAPTATLNPGAQSGIYTLTLDTPKPWTLTLNNAPGRRASFDAMTGFVDAWPARFGTASLPNAALAGLNEEGGLGLYLLSLSEPSYDEALNRVTYTATPLVSGHGTLGGLNRSPVDLSHGRLYIDGAGTMSYGVDYAASHYADQAINDTPSWTDIDSDFQVMKSHFDVVRTYTMDLFNTPRVARAAKRYGLKLAVGIGWEYEDTAANDLELELFKFVFGIYPELQELVDYVIVGNEACQTNNKPAWNDWLSYYNQVSTWITTNWTAEKRPTVTMSERAGVWEGNEDQCGGYLRSKLPAGTPLFVNIYPFWENCTAAGAIGGTESCSLQQQWNTLTSKVSNPIIVGETGWPTGGQASTDPPTQTPTLADAVTYWSYIYNTFLDPAPSRLNVLFAFEAFDEPLKPMEGNSPDLAHHWGMYGSMREVKTGITFPLNRTVTPQPATGAYVNVVVGPQYQSVEEQITVSNGTKKKYTYAEWNAAGTQSAGYPWFDYNTTVTVHLPANNGNPKTDCTNRLLSGHGIGQPGEMDLAWQNQGPTGTTAPCSQINWANNGIFLP